MKKHYLLSAGAVALMGLFSFTDFNSAIIEGFSHDMAKNGGAAPTGKTGAPGEQNCTECHSAMGGAQDGSSQNLLTVADGLTPITSYVPGQTYNVTLGLQSNPAKRGFSATALDGSNNMAGSFTGQALGGTQVNTGGGREYATHTDASNEASELSTGFWIWEWTAPATDVGQVTFYVASNEANGNNTSTGDVIYTSFHPINSAAGVEEVEETISAFTAGYSAANNKLILNFTTISTDNMYVNLVDMNGRSVYQRTLGSAMIGENHEELAIPNIKNGMYVVHFFVGNRATSKKIMVSK